MSGIGFESGGLASAHAIHNGLTALPETDAYFHGEQVVLGVLAGLQLADAPPDNADDVHSFCDEVGLPTTLGDLDLGGTDRKGLRTVAVKACAPGASIHHEAGGMTPDRGLRAILAADAVGKHRIERHGHGHTV